MITIKEIQINDIEKFWEKHIKYLIEDEIITDEEDINYFKSDEYRGVIKDHIERSIDKGHLGYFYESETEIGAVSYCTYQSEDGKCFILDYWIYPEFRNVGYGHRCFEALMEYTKQDGAKYYEINCERDNAIRFWKSLGFIENGYDEYDMALFIRK